MGEIALIPGGERQSYNNDTTPPPPKHLQKSDCFLTERLKKNPGNYYRMNAKTRSLEIVNIATLISRWLSGGQANAIGEGSGWEGGGERQQHSHQAKKGKSAFNFKLSWLPAA